MARDKREKRLVADKYVKKYKFHEEIIGDILWWQILAAEDDKNCPTGTLDSVVCVDQGNGSICLWFNEFKRYGKARVKRRATGKVEDNYSDTQLYFVNKMKGKPKILCTITDDIKDFWDNLNRAKSL